jgi:hypothetical protein
LEEPVGTETPTTKSVGQQEEPDQSDDSEDLDESDSSQLQLSLA